MADKWVLRGKRGDFEGIGKEHGISPMLARLLVNRQIETSEQVREYLHGGLEDLHDGAVMADMTKARDILLEAKRQGSPVGIASDFDCDGIFSGYVLQRGLKRLGIENRIYTPERVAEGYGLNRRIVDQAKAEGCKILLTCDNGIAAKEEIAYAKEEGLTVIVTDHHQVQGELPVADAVVDPQRSDCPYPFKSLCGAGVAFKLIGLLYEAEAIEKEEWYQLLPYVAMATVADVMDLVGENRILVREGLGRLNQTDNLGLQALINAQGIQGKTLRAYHIGFVLGPCFNASGRLETVSLAFDLLHASTQEQAQIYANRLKSLNDERKAMTEEGTLRAMKLVEEAGYEDQKVLVLYLSGCHESLVGIIAGRVKERYYRPTIVFTDSEEGTLKGSARSIEEYDMFQCLTQCKDLMLRYGGHPMAAGLTIPKENLEPLRQQLNQLAPLTKEDLRRTVYIDIPMPIGAVTQSFIEELERLEPVGKGNQKPVFAEQHFRIQKAIKRGKTGNVLSVTLVNDKGHVGQGIMFRDVDLFENFLRENFGAQEMEKVFAGLPNQVDVAFTYYPTLNEYNGYTTVQLTLGEFCVVDRT